MKAKFFTIFMNKSIFYLTGITLFFLAIACGDKDNDVQNNSAEIQFIETVLSGCNNPEVSQSILKSSVQDIDTEKDTVIISETKDSIRVFVGHIYSCGAPFVTDCEVKEDSVIMSIADTCTDGNCYARCICYYKFDFLFKKQSEHEYGYRILLINPRQDSPQVIAEGILQSSDK
jgi:hypothetical protein